MYIYTCLQIVCTLRRLHTSIIFQKITYIRQIKRVPNPNWAWAWALVWATIVIVKGES